jgi:hypothetical protein
MLHVATTTSCDHADAKHLMEARPGRKIVNSFGRLVIRAEFFEELVELLTFLSRGEGRYADRVWNKKTLRIGAVLKKSFKRMSVGIGSPRCVICELWLV